MERVARERPEIALAVTTNLDGWNLPAGVRVVELGHVSDDELAALYRGCLALAFPSRYEGFGLPVLEAMSYGAPVIAARASAVPEAGGEAAYYVAVDDAGGLAAAILRVRDDVAFAQELRRRGPPHAAAFTWERTAAHTLAVIEGTLA